MVFGCNNVTIFFYKKNYLISIKLNSQDTVIINFCLRVARFYSDKVITGEANRVVVQKCALSTVLTFYENAKRNNWSMVEADYNEYAGERLKNYITRVLGKKLNLLKYVASIDNLDMVVDYD